LNTFKKLSFVSVTIPSLPCVTCSDAEVKFDIGDFLVFDEDWRRQLWNCW